MGKCVSIESNTRFARTLTAAEIKQQREHLQKFLGDVNIDPELEDILGFTECVTKRVESRIKQGIKFFKD